MLARSAILPGYICHSEHGELDTCFIESPPCETPADGCWAADFLAYRENAEICTEEPGAQCYYHTYTLVDGQVGGVCDEKTVYNVIRCKCKNANSQPVLVTVHDCAT